MTKMCQELPFLLIFEKLSTILNGNSLLTPLTSLISCVLNNGHASEFFALENGLRQGCFPSGLLLHQESCQCNKK